MKRDAASRVTLYFRTVYNLITYFLINKYFTGNFLAGILYRIFPYKNLQTLYFPDIYFKLTYFIFLQKIIVRRRLKLNYCTVYTLCDCTILLCTFPLPSLQIFSSHQLDSERKEKVLRFTMYYVHRLCHFFKIYF